MSSIGDTGINLPESMASMLTGAMMAGHPAVVGYTGADGKPHLSFRGSVQRYSSSQLALWHRNPGSGIAAALADNPYVSVLYGDILNAKRSVLTFNGRAQVNTSEDVRRTVYDAMPPQERDRDPGFAGVAVIIDIDDVAGLYEGSPLTQKR